MSYPINGHFSPAAPPVTNEANTTTHVTTTALGKMPRSPLKRKRAASPPVFSQLPQSFLERLPRDTQIRTFSYLTLHDMLMAVTDRATREILVGRKALLQKPLPNGIIPYAYAEQTESQLVEKPLTRTIQTLCSKLGVLLNNKKIHSVELFNATDQELQAMIDRYPYIRTLSLTGQTGLSHVGLSHLQKLTELHMTHITLSGRRITRNDIEHLRQLSSLTHLSFEDCVIDDHADLSLLRTLPLISLSFSRSKNIKLEQLSDFHQLQSLNLTRCNETIINSALLHNPSRVHVRTRSSCFVLNFGHE